MVGTELVLLKMLGGVVRHLALWIGGCWFISFLPLETKLTHSGNTKVGIVKCVAQLASNTTSSFAIHVGFLVLLRALGLILDFLCFCSFLSLARNVLETKRQLYSYKCLYSWV